MNGHESCFENKDHIMGEFGIRDMFPKKTGVFIKRHVHNYGHLETVEKGSIRLTLELPEETKVKEFKAGSAVYIPEGAYHTAEALEDNTIVRCIFFARNAEGEVIRTNDGWDFDFESSMVNDPSFT